MPDTTPPAPAPAPIPPKTRIEALADLEQLAAIALAAMNPAWQSLAIAHLRADLLALGVTDAELIAAGITVIDSTGQRP